MVAKLSDRVEGTYKPYSLYYDGNAKITATVDGVEVEGTLESSGDVSVGGDLTVKKVTTNVAVSVGGDLTVDGQITQTGRSMWVGSVDNSASTNLYLRNSEGEL